MEKKQMIELGVGIAVVLGVTFAIFYVVRKKKDDIVKEYVESGEEFVKAAEKAIKDIPEQLEEAVNDTKEDFDKIYNDIQESVKETADEVEKLVRNVNGDISLEEAVEKYIQIDEEYSVELIDEDEYREIPDYNKREYQYFVLDDILANASTMEEIDPNTDIFKVGVNALMNSLADVVHVKYKLTGEAVEISPTDENYLDVYRELHGTDPGFGKGLEEDAG